MKYINTRAVPVRVFTSKGVVHLDGLSTIELDEVVSVPEFVKVEGAPEPVVETTVATTEAPKTATTTEKKKRTRRTTKKVEE